MQIKSCVGIAQYLQNARLIIELEDENTLELTVKEYGAVDLISCFKLAIEEVESNDSDK